MISRIRPSREESGALSWIWLVPVVAAIAGAGLVLRTWLEAGPTHHHHLSDGGGPEAGKTQIRYKDVNVGLMQSIRLSDDRSRRHYHRAIGQGGRVARPGRRTTFWVVRPAGFERRFRPGHVAVRGLYRRGRAAHARNRPAETEFTGLEVPPEVAQDRAGKRFQPHAHTVGSLDIGSPDLLPAHPRRPVHRLPAER